MPQVSEFVTGFGYGFLCGIAVTVLVGLLCLIWKVRRELQANEPRLREAERRIDAAIARYNHPDTTLYEHRPRPAEWPCPPGPKGFAGKRRDS